MSMTRSSRPYLRDVHDHLHLISEEVAARRTSRHRLQANMAVISVEQTRVSVRQNATMQQLTILATVFLPLTFITGFFGQNFAWLVDNITGFTRFAVFGIGGLLVPLVCSGCGCRRNQRATATAETHGTVERAAADRVAQRAQYATPTLRKHGEDAALVSFGERAGRWWPG